MHVPHGHALSPQGGRHRFRVYARPVSRQPEFIGAPRRAGAVARRGPNEPGKVNNREGAFDRIEGWEIVHLGHHVQ